jgi:hypothetical protein
MDKYSSASAAGHKRNKYKRREHHTHFAARSGIIFFTHSTFSPFERGALVITCGHGGAFVSQYCRNQHLAAIDLATALFKCACWSTI